MGEVVKNRIRIPFSVRLSHLLISIGLGVLVCIALYGIVFVWTKLSNADSTNKGLVQLFSIWFILQFGLFASIPSLLICDALNRRYRKKINANPPR
jgi:glucan phosphoethanolaminetransferase (alkaline phosphatase superfamily)